MLHSKQWHYRLHRDFQNCILHEEVLQDSSAPILQGYPYTYIIHQSREFSIQNPILHAEDKELFEYYYYYIQRTKRPSVQNRNSTHRRQRDLLEIHLYVLQDLPKAFQAFQLQDLPKAFQTFQSLQTFQSFMTFQPLQAILQVPVSPGNPPYSSILQLDSTYSTILQFDWFPQKTPLSTSWTIQTINILQTFILQRKGDVAILVKLTYSPE